MENLKKEAQEVLRDLGETKETPAPKGKKIRFGRFPDWQFPGWQVLFFFGALPDPQIPRALIMGWRTFLLGVVKVRGKIEPQQEVTGEHVRGTILQGQVWLPWDRFGKL